MKLRHVSVLGPDTERAAVQVRDGHRGLGHQLHIHRHTGDRNHPEQTYSLPSTTTHRHFTEMEIHGAWLLGLD